MARIIYGVTITAVLGLAPTAFAYQVWSSTLNTPGSILETPDQWDKVAAQLEGFNFNFAPKPDQPSEVEWQAILGEFVIASNVGYVPWNHPREDTSPITQQDVEDYVLPRLHRFGAISATYVMLTDTQSQFTHDDIRTVRSSLDNLGYPHIKLLYNARNFGTRQQSNLLLPEIDGCVNEGGPESWMSNTGGRQDLLRWYLTNDTTQGKLFLFHTLVNNFGEFREMVRAVSTDFLQDGGAWASTDQAIFLPMTYEPYDEQFSYLPQHNEVGNAYTNSMCSLLLSLIEQEPLFVGTAPGGFLSEADCYSYERTNYFTAVADGNITDNATWDGAAPVPGDLHEWYTGTHTIGVDGAAPNSTTVFNGRGVVVSPGGTLAANAPGATIQMNKLMLYGGAVQANRDDAFVLDMNEKKFWIDSGSLYGGTAAGQDLQFQNGTVTGTGSVAVEALGAAGGQVEFADSMNLDHFRGTFDVASDGLLNLPPAPMAAFNLKLSGAGRYANDADVRLMSLHIADEALPCGIYNYADFTPTQQAFLLNTTGQISVFGNTTALIDGQLEDSTTWLVGPPVVGDPYTWQSGQHFLSATNGAFHGNTLAIQTEGRLDFSSSGVTLNLNNLTLDGGTIYSRKLNSNTLDLTVNTLTLNSGTIFTGRTSLTLRNGNAVGEGAIDITGLRYEESSQTIFELDMNGFTGTFNVHSNGILDLPGVSYWPSFDLNLSGTGRYTNDAEVAVESLTIEGESFPPGAYHYEDFTPAQQALLLNNPGGRIVVFGLNIALNDGPLNEANTWGGLQPPQPGDDQVWYSGIHTVKSDGIEVGEEVTFYGETLVIEPNGILQATKGNSILYVNNVVLDGGMIYDRAIGGYTLDLTGDVLTLNSGSLQGFADGRNIYIRNGRLAGSGVIDIETDGTKTGAEIRFEDSIDTTGFNGVFSIQNGGLLNLPDIDWGSFELRISGDGRYMNDSDIAVRILDVNDISFPAGGTYTYSDFQALGLEDYLVSDQGTITVVECVTPPVGDIAGNDCIVDRLDFTAMSLNWLQSGLVGGECVNRPVGDIAGDDCRVDLADFAVLVSSWMDCGVIPSTACP